MKRQFEVLLTATMQKSFVIEAADEDEARELLEKRWATGVGGEMEAVLDTWLGSDDKAKYANAA